MVDKEQWVAMDTSSKSIAMSTKDWDKSYRTTGSMIHVCLLDLVLLDVS